MAGSPELVDRAAYLPRADALVCADLHLGRDAASNVELPLGEAGRIPERLSALLDRFDPAELVLAGDTLHAFDAVPDSVAEALDAVAAAAAAADARLTFVGGNHDLLLPSIVDREVEPSRRLDDGTVVVHGDGSLPDPPSGTAAQRFVIGHEHPAIVVEGQRHPCYLEGPAAGREASVLVLPAFNRLTRGTVVNGARGDDLSSPAIGTVERYRPAVLDETVGEVLWFPPLEQFRQHL